MSLKKLYNRSIIQTEKFNLSPKELWGIISAESNLEDYHPFCKSNTPIEWSDDNHSDKLEYLNGTVFERHFLTWICLLYTSPSPRDATLSRMPSSA